MLDFYKLVNRKPVLVSPEEGHRLIGSTENILVVSWLDQYLISTIFLVMDHSHFNSKPVLFETMVFEHTGKSRKPLKWQFRYSSFDNALRGHLVMVRFVQRIYRTHKTDHYAKGLTQFRFRQAHQQFLKKQNRQFTRQRFSLTPRQKREPFLTEPIANLKALLK